MQDSLKQYHFPLYHLQAMITCLSSNDDRQQALAAAGLDAEQLYSTDILINGEQFQAAMNAIIARMDDSLPPSLTWLQHFPLTVHGYLGLAIISSPNAAKALELALGYYDSIMPAAEILHHEDEQQMVLTFALKSDFGTPLSNHIIEHIIGSFEKINSVTATPIQANEIHFRHRPFVSAAVYEDYFQTPIVFSAPENRMVFDKAVLATPLTTAHPATLALLEQQLADSRPQSMTTRFADKVKQELQQQAAAGIFLSQGQLAERFFMSERTLARKLAAEQTQYQQLMSNIRLSLAQQLLSRSDKTLQQIALLCGFQSETGFSRFFKKCAGQTPSQFRRETSGKSH